MSASDHLSIQFVHHENYGDHSVHAMHGDKRVGELGWRSKDAKVPLPTGYMQRAGEIAYVDVEEPYRKRGIATGMLNYAATVEPRLHHGKGVSDGGRGLIKSMPHLGPGR